MNLAGLSLTTMSPPGVLGFHGAAGSREATLGWVLITIACVVTLVVSLMVLAGTWRRDGDGLGPPRESQGGGKWIVFGGLVIPVLVLAAVFGLTVTTQAAVSPTLPSDLTVRITGHRWWWEVRYPGESNGPEVVTANEIHIPIGQRVRFELVTDDVIHSFWVPELGGKTDLIPGQTNVTWLEADSVGVYRGQCAEYCGTEHAHMALSIVADSAGQFRDWMNAERQPASAVSDSDAAIGKRVFLSASCATCHAIRGGEADGHLGPDLTHLASRRRIAAGLLPNTRGNLAGWVANPQALKPGTLMPSVPLQPTELLALVSYLQALK